jgi:DNA-binding MarR family transcriptional regulator
MLDQFEGDGIVVDKAIGFWIQRVYQRSRGEMYRLFREQGVEMTPEQWMVILRLWEADGPSQSDLCEATLRDAPTMSRILATMERSGLVVRRPAPDDARARHVFLTKEGRALRKKLVPVARGLVERMVRGIHEEDLAAMRRTLIRMFENLEG